MHYSDDKIEKIEISNKYRHNLDKINYCLPGILSKCSAGTSWVEQRVCKYAVKSNYANKCIYFIESIDGHCDCMDAQRDAMTIMEG